MSVKYLITSVLSLFLFSQTGHAGSLYGHFGIGERQYAVSARSLGMGGVNLALFDEFTLSRWNPAQWSNISPVRINLRSLTSYNSVTEGTSSIFTDFNGFSMGIPMGSKFTVGGSIYPISTSRYGLSQSGTTNGEAWNLAIKGNGGISSFGLGTSYQINDRLSIGIKNDWLFGMKEQESVTEFDNSNLESSIFIKSNSFGGTLLTIGFFTNSNKLKYAGSITMPLKITVIKKITYTTISPEISPKEEIDYPTEFRLGFTYDLDEQYKIGLDYQRSDWSSFDSDFNGKFGIAYDIFGGIERKMSPRKKNLFKKLAIRSGFTIRRLYTGGLEKSFITEKALTFGIGLPTHDGKEIIDVGFSYGLRGSNDNSTIEETTFLFMLGFSAGEKWFTKRRR